MGFLRRLLRPRELPAGPITDWSDGNMDRLVHRVAIMDASRRTLRVVGCSSYQGSLEAIGGGRTIDGAKVRDHFAVLLPEPHNVYDSNAVRVVLTQQGDKVRSAVVGYLSREDAVAYRPVIDRVAAGGLILACRASIEGGWARGGDIGNFGVRLYLGTPAGLMREIDEAEWSAQVPPAPPDWQAVRAVPATSRESATGEFAGKMVCFTGESRCHVDGRLLSREEQERLAAELGLTVHPRLTKKVDVLVVSHPGYQSGKTIKAEQYGTRIVIERDFWPAVGVTVDC